MNTYQTSTGERIKQSVIDRKTREAKAAKLEQTLNDNGFISCEDCGTTQGYLDCSHTISVKTAKETGRTELAWSVENIKVLCRLCHSEYDKNNLQFTK